MLGGGQLRRSGCCDLCVLSMQPSQSSHAHGRHTFSVGVRRARPQCVRLPPSRASLAGLAMSDILHCRAERSDQNEHGLTLIIHSTHRREVGIGGSLMSPQWPKRSIFAPRGAFGCGCGGAMITGGRNHDPMPSCTPTSFPHGMPSGPDHRSASAVPVLTGGAGG